MLGKLVLISVQFLTLLSVYLRVCDIAINLRLLPNHTFVEPLKELKLNQLRHILDTRGISYIKAVEKSDLIELIRASGNVSQQEITNFNNNKNNNNLYIETQVFTDSNDFYYNWFNNSSDDDKSVLVVSVIPSSGEPIHLQLWRQLVTTLSQLGIKTGVFNCSHEPSVCKSRKWISPKLVLISRGIEPNYKSSFIKLYHISKDEMTKMVESPLNVHQKILSWLSAELAVHVPVLHTEYNLNYYLLQQQQKTSKLIFITTLKTGPPLVLSSLAVKFRRRIEFAMFRVDNNYITKKLGSLAIPSYLITKPGDKRYYYNYGQNYGEFISYDSMNSFLTTFTLDLNDLFNNSFYLLNIAIGLQLFILTNSSFNIANHIFNCIPRLLVCNSILLLIIWPLILIINTMFKSNYCYQIYQMMATTQVAAVIRYDYQHYYSVKALITTFITFSVILTANSFKRYPKIFAGLKKILLLKMKLLEPEINMCTVCFDDTIEGQTQNIVLQECEHHFHKVCIVNWFTRSSSMSCPNCRTRIDVNRYLTDAEIKERNRLIENSIIDSLIQLFAMTQNLNNR
jgi:hypothetical protein